MNSHNAPEVEGCLIII